MTVMKASNPKSAVFAKLIISLILPWPQMEQSLFQSCLWQESIA